GGGDLLLFNNSSTLPDINTSAAGASATAGSVTLSSSAAIAIRNQSTGGSILTTASGGVGGTVLLSSARNVATPVRVTGATETTGGITSGNFWVLSQGGSNSIGAFAGGVFQNFTNATGAGNISASSLTITFDPASVSPPTNYTAGGFTSISDSVPGVVLTVDTKGDRTLNVPLIALTGPLVLSQTAAGI